MPTAAARAGPQARMAERCIGAAPKTPAGAALPSIRRRCQRRRQSAGATLQSRRVRGKVRLHVLGERHGDAEVVARDEAQLVERPRVLLALRAVLRRRPVVLEELLDRAEVAQGVPRVHGAEVLLRKQPAVARVGVDRPERIAGQRMAVLERARSRIADGGQELEERGVFPVSCENYEHRRGPLTLGLWSVPRKYLQLVGGRKRPVLKLGKAVKRANFDECAYEKGCNLGRGG